MVNDEPLFRQLKHSQTLPTKIHPFIFNIIIQGSKRRLLKWTEFDLNIFFIYLSRKNKTVILGQTSMLFGKFSKEHFVAGQRGCRVLKHRLQRDVFFCTKKCLEIWQLGSIWPTFLERILHLQGNYPFFSLAPPVPCPGKGKAMEWLSVQWPFSPDSQALDLQLLLFNIY